MHIDEIKIENFKELFKLFTDATTEFDRAFKAWSNSTKYLILILKFMELNFYFIKKLNWDS